MNTTIRSNRGAMAIFALAALLGVTCVLFGRTRKEAPPSAEKAPARTPVVELRENAPSDSEASYPVPVRSETGPEPQRDGADNGEQLIAIENRTKIVDLEREERLLLEAIIAAKAGSVLTAETENIYQAERALEHVTDRYIVGAGTQIEVFNAQTALTEARASYLDALRIYSAPRATLVRAPGARLQH